MPLFTPSLFHDYHTESDVWDTHGQLNLGMAMQAAIRLGIISDNDLQSSSLDLRVKIFSSPNLVRLLGLTIVESTSSRVDLFAPPIRTHGGSSKIHWKKEEAILTLQQMQSLSNENLQRLDNQRIVKLLLKEKKLDGSRLAKLKPEDVYSLTEKQYNVLSGKPVAALQDDGTYEQVVPFDWASGLFRPEMAGIAQKVLILIENMPEGFEFPSGATGNLLYLASPEEILKLSKLNAENLTVLLKMPLNEHQIYVQISRFLALARPKQLQSHEENTTTVLREPVLDLEALYSIDPNQFKAIIEAAPALDQGLLTFQEAIALTSKQAETARVLGMLPEDGGWFDLDDYSTLLPRTYGGPLETRTEGAITKADIYNLSPLEARIISCAWLCRGEHGKTLDEVRTNLPLIAKCMIPNDLREDAAYPYVVFRTRGYTDEQIAEFKMMSLVDFIRDGYPCLQGAHSSANHPQRHGIVKVIGSAEPS